LSDVEKQVVEADTDFDIVAVSQESNHYKVLLKSPINNYDCWYVFEQDAQIKVKHAEGKLLTSQNLIQPIQIQS
jgi:hypothetical protein